MNAEVIGTWAGQVWNALNESGKLTVKGLKKATKLKEKEFTVTEYAVIERNPKTENSYRILRKNCMRPLAGWLAKVK